MIIALPPTDHDHLADALVRDLGFTRTHVDAPIRELLLALDPYVDAGVTLANMGPSPRLSSKLEQVGGRNMEEKWTRLLYPPRPGSSPDRTATEVKRLLGVLREHELVDTTFDVEDDTVIIGNPHQRFGQLLVAISSRVDDAALAVVVDYWIPSCGVVGEQQAIVAYVQGLREANPPGFPDEYKEIAKMFPGEVPPTPTTDEEWANVPVLDLEKAPASPQVTPQDAG